MADWWIDESPPVGPDGYIEKLDMTRMVMYNRLDSDFMRAIETIQPGMDFFIGNHWYGKLVEKEIYTDPYKLVFVLALRDG